MDLREHAPTAHSNGDEHQSGVPVIRAPIHEFADLVEAQATLLPPPIEEVREVQVVGIYQVVIDRYPGKLTVTDFGMDGYRPDSLEHVYDERGNPFTIIRRSELGVLPGGESVKNEGPLRVTKKVFDGTIPREELPPDERRLRTTWHIRDSRHGEITVAEYEELRLAPGEEIVDIFGPYKRTIRVFSSRLKTEYPDDGFEAHRAYSYTDTMFGEVTILMRSDKRIVPGSQIREDTVTINGMPVRVRRMWVEGRHNKDDFNLRDTPHRIFSVAGLQGEEQTMIEYFLV